MWELRYSLSESMTMAIRFHRVPAFGEHGGTLLLWDLGEKGKISLFTEIFMGNLRGV